MEGFLLVNKPRGWTSFDVVAKIRRITGIRKIGHAGTLDPLATGLLILAIGSKATKRINFFVGLEKEYSCTFRLGMTSDTDDTEGNLIHVDSKVPKEVPRSAIDAVLPFFTGVISQVPPQYSAVKFKGRRAYDLARKGKTFALQAREVEIHSLVINEYAWPFLKLNIVCSRGTYIRSLARDIGLKLECGAFVSELCRTRIGSYRFQDAVLMENLSCGKIENVLFF